MVERFAIVTTNFTGMLSIELFTDEFLYSYNYEGRQGKKPLKQLKTKQYEKVKLLVLR